MNKLDKGFAHIFVIFGIVILIAIGGWWMWRSGYIIRTEKESPDPPSPTKTVEEIPDDWKTYRNEEYGFEFMYPPSYHIREKNYTVRIIDNRWKDKQIHHSSLRFVIVEEKLTAFELAEKERKKYLNEGWNVWGSDCLSHCLSEAVPETVGKNIDSLKYTVSAQSSVEEIFIVKEKIDNRIIKIHNHMAPTGVIPEHTVNQILSTFEFIEQTDKSSSNSENSAFFSQFNENDNIHIVLNKSFNNTGPQFKLTNSDGETIGPFQLYNTEEYPDEIVCPQLEVYGDVYWTNDNLVIPDDFGSFSYDWKVSVITQNETIEIDEPLGICSSGAS